MVGSELPSPETREKTVTDIADLELDDVIVHGRRTARRPLVDHVSASPCTRARSSASPASRATARASWSRRSDRPRARRPARSRSTARTSPNCPRRSAAPPASATSPRTGRTTASCSPFTLWENAALGHQRDAPFGKGLWIDRAGAAAPHRADHRQLRRPHAGRRGADLHAVGRQPAEADRRAGDHGRPVDADRLASHPRRRRRRPGGDLGHPPRCPQQRSGARCSCPPISRS